MKVVIVGAGLASAIAVYLLQREYSDINITEYSDVDITVYEKNEIGGLLRNDTVNGITVQLYGPHVFHTTDNAVRDLMLEIFAKYNIHWETYYDQVLANVDNKLYSLPYSKLTGLSQSEYYHKIIEPYTLKQWGYINEQAINRLHQLNYYTMHYHANASFSCIFDHNTFFNKIFAKCHIIYKELSESDLEAMDADIKIYTGYRENCQFKYTQFLHELTSTDQGVFTVNYPDKSYPYTRVMDFTYLTNNPIVTSMHPICKEVPSDNGVVCYPLGTPCKEYNITYLGRFGKHSYVDMDTCVKNVLEWFNNNIK